jgi:ABC-type phosphate transport system substrate-binding protein
MLKDNKASQVKSKKFLQRSALLPTIIGAFIVGGALAYALLRSCSWGEYKANLVLCKSYQSIKDVQVQASEEFQYDGSTALLELGQGFENRIANVRQDFPLARGSIRDLPRDNSSDVIAWSGVAIQQLIEGNLDIALSSRDLAQKERDKATQAGFSLEAIPIANDGLAFFVNKNQDIDSLSLDEIVEIYTGRKRDWREFQSSKNLQINAFSPDPINNQGLPEYFQKEIMQDQQFSSNIQTGNPNPIIEKVAASEGGIGFASTSVFCDMTSLPTKPLLIERNGGSFSPCEGNQINSVAIANSTYPLTRQLFVVIRRDGTGKERAGVAYVNMLLSDEGQKLVEEFGYVPIR